MSRVEEKLDRSPLRSGKNRTATRRALHQRHRELSEIHRAASAAAMAVGVVEQNLHSKEAADHLNESGKKREERKNVEEPHGEKVEVNLVMADSSSMEEENESIHSFTDDLQSHRFSDPERRVTEEANRAIRELQDECERLKASMKSDYEAYRHRLRTSSPSQGFSVHAWVVLGLSATAFIIARQYVTKRT